MKVKATLLEIKDIDNVSFLTEYNTIRNEFNEKHLTDQSLEEILARWKVFIFKLINKNLMDKYVGYSLIDMFKESLSLN